MRRREFITLLSGAAAAWPIAARTQQAGVPVIGLLGIRTAEFDAPLLAEFIRGIRETGFVEGRNVKIEYRWAGGQFDRLPSFAEELVRRNVALIVTFGGTAATLAAKAASTTIPIVFAVGDDPVRSGLVSSLSRPGGKITGDQFLQRVGGKAARFVAPAAPYGHCVCHSREPQRSGC